MVTLNKENVMSMMKAGRTYTVKFMLDDNDFDKPCEFYEKQVCDRLIEYGYKEPVIENIDYNLAMGRIFVTVTLSHSILDAFKGITEEDMLKPETTLLEAKKQYEECMSMIHRLLDDWRTALESDDPLKRLELLANISRSPIEAEKYLKDLKNIKVFLNRRERLREQLNNNFNQNIEPYREELNYPKVMEELGKLS